MRRRPRQQQQQLLVVLLLLLLAAYPRLVQGGACWSNVNSAGRCKEILSQSVSKEECCNSGSNAPETTAYSDEDYDNGALFFWQVLGGGVKCESCRTSCKGVECSEGRKCVLRRGMPRCICKPECSRKRRMNARDVLDQGPVCGTDGRTYRNACKLKRRICRKGHQDLAVAYGGPCQSSCAGVRCRHGRSCLLDQNLSAHCVKCSRRCVLQGANSTTSTSSRAIFGGGGGESVSRPVCGVDGTTYKSACHLRAAACRAGRAIAIAYKGPCRKNAECKNIDCRSGQQCLVDPVTNRPRCVSCQYRCPRSKELVRERNRHKNRDFQDSKPLSLCASNNVTYPSWCHIMKDACLTGLVIETRHAGPCTLESSSNVLPGNVTTSGNSRSKMNGKGSKEYNLKKDLMMKMVVKNRSQEVKKIELSKDNVPATL